MKLKAEAAEARSAADKAQLRHLEVELRYQEGTGRLRDHLRSRSRAATEPPEEQFHEAEESPAEQPKPKRCKISREQLAVLIKSFEEEPLPNFDQRQALAKMLGMTPRSVQIWFQNRRQRLLKPQRQAEAALQLRAPTVCTSELTPLPAGFDNISWALPIFAKRQCVPYRCGFVKI